MANIDLGNLTRYDGKIKQYVEDKYLSKNTANWQMTEKAGAVTCYPVPDTELEPIVDFSFKEVPPTSGEKSPTNPSTIEGVSSIKCTKCNKNLIPFIQNITVLRNGVTFTVTEGIVTATGTSDNSNNSPFYIASAGGKDLRVLQGHTYFLSGCPAGGSPSTYFISAGYYDNNGNPIAYNVLRDYGNGSVFTPSQDGWLTSSIVVMNGVEVNNLIFKPQLEDSLYATNFEPFYHNVYTYQLGNTYYGGSVNLGTGIITVTQNFVTFTGTETGWRKTIYSNDSVSSFAIDLLPRSMKYPNLLVCSHFPRTAGYLKTPNTVWIWDNGICFICLPGSDVTTANFKEWLNNQYLANTPVTLTYPLTNPYVVQLDPIQIKSLTALDKNTPRLNTLYTDADSIQVGYQKHPARTSYELENAILALGGGE